MFRYKTMCKGMKSQHGNCKWKLGEWKKVKGEIELCENGFHCSKRLIDAMMYVSPIIVTKVEVKGEHHDGNDKQVWSEMRVVNAWNWTKEDSVALSIYSAELCLDNYEKIYPNDDRPRKAIEAAKKWLKNPTQENRSAARLAARSAESAARSAESAAWSAESAAWSAAWSARSAAESARSAAESAESAESAARLAAARLAAESAESAARSAGSAESAESAARSASWSALWSAESALWSAGSAAKEEILDKINKWCVRRLKKCEKIS